MSAVLTHPRAVELVARRRLRGKIERAVTRLLAVLDELDGDPEGEPNLGAPEHGELYPWQRRWADGAADDRESDAGDEPHGPESDDEPALAAPERHHDQRRWAAGSGDDREREHDGREPDALPARTPASPVARIARVALRPAAYRPPRREPHARPAESDRLSAAFLQGHFAILAGYAIQARCGRVPLTAHETANLAAQQDLPCDDDPPAMVDAFQAAADRLVDQGACSHCMARGACPGRGRP